MRYIAVVNTIGQDRFVCGGGWRSRPEDRFIKFKAICCLVLFFAAAFAVPPLADAIGMWSLLPAVVLLLASLLLFRFERPYAWWGMPDTQMAQPEQKATPRDPPEYDLHNLY